MVSAPATLVVETAARLRTLLEAIPDPELPMLDLGDLGIVRDVWTEGPAVTVTITPTFLGCPALDAIRRSIHEAVADEGYEEIEVVMAYAPPWSVDWISPDGREKLRVAGIAPPGAAGVCPLCSADSVRVVSPFGPTPCQAINACRVCGEPFTSLRDP
jgi:ring-1,2-phenylacetyl-CoA epoxidase subunit PaaD